MLFRNFLAVNVKRVIRVAAGLMLTWAFAASAASPLEHVTEIPMPGVKGRIDHFAVDVQGHRLFVAALGNDSVEVIDTAAKKHVQSIDGFGEPQGIAFVESPARLFVANGRGNRVDVLNGETLSHLNSITNLPDADNVRFDARARQILVGYGKGALRIIDVGASIASGRDVKLSGHPESFQLEKDGARVYVNVPDARHVAVVDRARSEVVAKWAVLGARANYPMALDEVGRRLFVGARSPAILLVYDVVRGKVVTTMPIGGDTDDVFFDADRKRIYVICGEGRIDVVQQESLDRYVLEASVKTAPRARTGLFAPAERTLYVAAPAVRDSPARILVYEAR